MTFWKQNVELEQCYSFGCNPGAAFMSIVIGDRQHVTISLGVVHIDVNEVQSEGTVGFWDLFFLSVPKNKI